MNKQIMPAAVMVMCSLAAMALSTTGEARAPRPPEVRWRSILDFMPFGTSLGCLNTAALRLLDRIETEFGAVQIISTCRPGASIAGTSKPSLHGSGNAIDFHAGDRKASIVKWLIEHHRGGGTMTYADMDHIHVDIGRRFVALAAPHWSSWSGNPRQRRNRQSQGANVEARLAAVGAGADH